MHSIWIQKIVYLKKREKEVTRIDKNGEKITKNISYTLHLIDSARFMTSSLVTLVNNIYEWFHKIKCKYGHDDNCGI